MGSGKRSAVTGGVGFVGRHLVDALVQRGDDVVLLDVASDPGRDGVDFRHVDIRDVDAIRDAIRGCEVVYHNASVVHTKQNREEFVWSVNLGGTENVMQACRDEGVSKLVYVSSGSVVYNGEDVQNGAEDMPYAAVSQAPYADSKIAAEKAVLAASDDTLRTCAIRPHVVFGPGDLRFLPNILSRARDGKLKYRVGNGPWLSDFTYVSNLIDALLLAESGLESGVACGEAYFITNGEPMGFFDFVSDVVSRLGYPPVTKHVPWQLAYGVAAIKESIDTLRGGKMRQEDGISRFAIRYMCSHHYFSIEKARRELGYEPRVLMDEGIHLTVDNAKKVGMDAAIEGAIA